MEKIIKHKDTGEVIKEIEYKKTRDINLRYADLRYAKITSSQKDKIIESLNLKIID